MNNFIQLARRVYFTNDERFEVKNKINIHFGSEISEQNNKKNTNNFLLKVNSKFEYFILNLKTLFIVLITYIKAFFEF